MEYQRLFESRAARRALSSHRGSDLGALSLAHALQRSHRVTLHASKVTRLLVDLNRSPGHPELFSEFSRGLDASERTRVLDRYYFPHRDAVASWIEARARRGRQVVHIGVHSFAPRIDGRDRTADVGLLYDPSRLPERVFCSRWKDSLRTIAPRVRVRRNYPYLGKSDGFTTSLRARHGSQHYLGIELEVNQRVLRSVESRRLVTKAVSDSLRAALGR